jgi:hypothetical protein
MCVLQRTAPRALRDILQEYTELKTAALERNKLTQALASVATSRGDVNGAASSSPVEETMQQLATLLADYAAIRQQVAAGTIPAERSSKKRAAASAAALCGTNGDAHDADLSSPAASAAAAADSAPAKRRRKSHPQRRIVPQVVPSVPAAPLPTHTLPITGLPLSSSLNSPPLPPLPTGAGSSPARVLSPFHLPAQIPLHDSEAFVNVSVDVQGFEQLFQLPPSAANAQGQGVETSSSFGQAIANFINKRAEQSRSAPAASSAAASTPVASDGPVSLSDAALQEITEMCLQDAATAAFLDRAFQLELNEPPVAGEADTPLTQGEVDTPMIESPPQSPLKARSHVAAPEASPARRSTRSMLTHSPQPMKPAVSRSEASVPAAPTAAASSTVKAAATSISHALSHVAPLAASTLMSVDESALLALLTPANVEALLKQTHAVEK